MNPPARKCNPKLLPQIFKAIMELRESKGSTICQILKQVRTSLMSNGESKNLGNIEKLVLQAVKEGKKMGIIREDTRGKYSIISPSESNQKRSRKPRVQDGRYLKPRKRCTGIHRGTRRRSQITNKNYRNFAKSHDTEPVVTESEPTGTFRADMQTKRDGLTSDSLSSLNTLNKTQSVINLFGK